MKMMNSVLTNQDISNKRKKEWAAFQSSLELLSKEGVLGLYKSFQVVELIAFPPQDYNQLEPVNIISVFTCSDGENKELTGRAEFINKGRIISNRMKRWSFGIFKYNKSIKDVKHLISNYIECSIWNTTGSAISVGELLPVKKQFVPADSFLQIALNKIIKNNFRNGSYLLELCDLTKDKLCFLLEDSKLGHVLNKLMVYTPYFFVS